MNCNFTTSQNPPDFLWSTIAFLATFAVIVLVTDSVAAQVAIKNTVQRQKSRLSLDLLGDPKPSNVSQKKTTLSLDSLVGEKPRTSTKKTTLSLDSLNGEESSLGNASSAASVNTSALADSWTPQQWSDNLRQTIDLSFRPVYSGPTGNFGAVSVVGLDLLKTFTSKDGDWGVLTLQPYFTRIDNIDAPNQTIFDDRHDFELVYRIFNFNFLGAKKGEPNFRIGHFELPFGLEHTNNTNGTLRDFTHLLNFGLDGDWGFSINGETTGIEYEAGLTRGSGNKFRSRSQPFILAGRVGTPTDEPIYIGVSAMHGEILQFDTAGGTSRRTRVGIDGVWSDEKYVWLSELSAGFQDDDRVFTALLERDWYNEDETLLVYHQFVIRGLGTDSWDSEVRHSFGFRRQCNRHWAISGQVSHFFDRIEPASRGTVIQWQGRYRF